LVRRGTVDLFCVALADDAPVGPRHPLCQVPEGEIVFGFPAAANCALLAVGRLDTVVERVGADVFAAWPLSRRIQLTERWIGALADAAFGAAPPWPEHLAAPGATVAVPEEQSLYAGRDIVWVRVLSGTATVGGERIDDGRLVPVAAGLAVTAVSAISVETVTTHEALAHDPLALDGFHALILAAAGWLIAAAEAAGDERLEARRSADHRGLQSALQLLVKSGTAARPEVRQPMVRDPTVGAFAAVARHQGVGLERTPRAASSSESWARSLARANGLGLRQVLLRGRWWRSDSGPLIGWRGEERRPVALLPAGRRSYRTWDPAAGTAVAVDNQLAAEIAPTATMVYRPLPLAATKLRALVGFSLSRLGRELAVIGGLALLGAAMSVLFPLAMGMLFNSAVPRAETREVFTIILGLSVAAIGAGVFDLTQAIALLRVEGRLDTAMQPALMLRLLALPARFFRDFESGELTNRVLAIQSIRRVLAGNTLQSLLAAGLAIANFVVILFVSPLLGLVAGALAVVASIAIAALVIAQLRQERLRIALRGQEDGLVLQVVQGIAKIRVAAAETRIFSVWAEIFARQKQRFRSGQRFALAADVVVETFPLLAVAVLFFAASRLLAPADGGTATLGLGGFLVVNAAFGQFLAAVTALSRTSAATLEIVPLFERLRPVLAATPETVAEKNEAPPLSGGIEASHLVFRYVEGARPVLDDVSFHIEPSSFVAFVGPSGSGKSTLLRMLLGFETPESGDVLYDGQSIRTLDPGSLRRQIGVVLQHGRVNTGSIFENITSGLPYTLADAWTAARLAGIDHDIEAMPMGMHTMLIEGSSTLSGGQRQRLMIARALIGRPKLLIFDEATSALDNRSQAAVTQSLDALRTTRIIVAHRLSTVQRADTIFVMEAGKIVESGNFETLVARDGLFARMAQRQIL
jgi:ATP-binding cassette subfamily C protein